MENKFGIHSATAELEFGYNLWRDKNGAMVRVTCVHDGTKPIKDFYKFADAVDLGVLDFLVSFHPSPLQQYEDEMLDQMMDEAMFGMNHETEV